MTRRVLAACVVSMALSTWSRPASADTILITGGQLQMEALSGTLELIGERGFTLSAGVSVIDSFFGPWVTCNANLTCFPGTTINLNANFTGSSLHGATVTLDGQTFTNVTSAAALTGASAIFAGSATAPPLDGDTAIVVSPFTFQGLFSYPPGPGLVSVQELLIGQGNATITLERMLGGETGLAPRWRYASAQYEFDPIPEPATMLLTGAGLVALARLRQRRQTRCDR